MRRGGFTMIELIFVIVILGILAAVALPKFIGVTEQAQAGKLKGFVGTMNRTVLPTLWSKSIAEGKNGSIKNLSVSLSDYIDIPQEATINNFPGGCNAGGSGSIGTYLAGSKNITIYCRDGNQTNAPFLTLVSGSTEANLTIQ